MANFPWYWSGWRNASCWKQGEPVLVSTPTAEHTGHRIAMRSEDFVATMDDLLQIDPFEIYLDRFLREFDGPKLTISEKLLYKIIVLPPLLSDLTADLYKWPTDALFINKTGAPMSVKPMEFGRRQEWENPITSIAYDPVEIPNQVISKLFTVTKVDSIEELQKALSAHLWVIDSTDVVYSLALLQAAALYGKQVVFWRKPNLFPRRGWIFEWFQKQPEYWHNLRGLTEDITNLNPLPDAFRNLDIEPLKQIP